MAAYSRILAWRIPWTEEPGRLQSLGRKELDKAEATARTHACREFENVHTSYPDSPHLGMYSEKYMQVHILHMHTRATCNNIQ